jgi:hypothetical protein
MVRFAILALCAISAQGGAIVLSNTTTGLVDDSTITRSVTVNGVEAGFGTGTIASVLVSVNFAKADGESFDTPFPGGTPFFNEISFGLTGPSSTLVTLIATGSWSSGSGQFDGTILFDEAAASVVNSGAAPVAGTFRTTGPGSLNDFVSQSALGIWTLTIGDSVGGDALRFRSFDLTINTIDRLNAPGASIAVATPEPGSWALMGAGMLALGALGLRRKR